MAYYQINELFSDFELDWIIELVEDKYAEFESGELGVFFDSDRKAFESILEKVRYKDF